MKKTIEQLGQHLESYPVLYSISHTIATVVVCITIVVLSLSASTVTTKWKELSVQQTQSRIEADKEAALAQIEAEIARMEVQARIEEAKAATNPYQALAGEPSTEDFQLDDLQPVRIGRFSYNSYQRKLLQLAFHVGEEYGFPETLQSILLQETLAGKLGNKIGDTSLPTLKRSYGVMQVKVGTARHVMQMHPDLVVQYFPGYTTESKLRDEEIIIKLITDDVFTIKIAALYFQYLHNTTKDWAKSVVAYNQGLGGANAVEDIKSHRYYVKIISHMTKQVRPFNATLGLSPNESS